MSLLISFYLILFLILTVILVLRTMRRHDNLSAQAVWRKLEKNTEKPLTYFDVSMISETSELVKKFFLYLIKPGSPLYRVSVIHMEGALILDKKNDKTIEVECEQILSPLTGFVWKVKSKTGFAQFSGSDGLIEKHGWSSMWLMGLYPMIQNNKNHNLAKSAFGRLVAESIIWGLPSLLPKKDITWETVNSDTIRVTVTSELMSQLVDVTVDQTGKPREIRFSRWSNANPMKQFQFQTFGAKLADFKQIQGYMVPTKIEAGNNFGEKQYIPFYQMSVNRYEYI